MDSGFLYVAIGEKYVDEARHSAKSLKRASSDAKICIATDQELEPDEDFDVVIGVEPKGEKSDQYMALDSCPYYQKLYPLMESPFQKTVFLDTDTWIIEPLEDLFALLDSYDVLVTPVDQFYDYAFEHEEEPFSKIPKAFGYFNTGLFAYRKGDRTTHFLQEWARNFEQHVSRHTVNDQPAMRLALYECDIRHHVLPSCYNTQDWVPFVIPSGGSIAMLHGRNPWLQRWSHHLNAKRITLVGNLSFKHLFLYQAARILYAIQRLFARGKA